jgi:hypothetical protein
LKKITVKVQEPPNPTRKTTRVIDNKTETQSVKTLYRAQWCVKRVPVHCLVTLVEERGVRRPALCVTLKVLVFNGESFRRQYMDHTVDPGREDHQELGLGC